MTAILPETITTFITRWENSGAAERANYQMFLAELCDLLQVPRPDPTSPDPEKNLYVFDRAVPRVNPDGSSVTNYIDLYKAGHFVCETKQGASETPVAAAYDRRDNETAGAARRAPQAPAGTPSLPHPHRHV